MHCKCRGRVTASLLQFCTRWRAKCTILVSPQPTRNTFASCEYTWQPEWQNCALKFHLNSGVRSPTSKFSAIQENSRRQYFWIKWVTRRKKIYLFTLKTFAFMWVRLLRCTLWLLSRPQSWFCSGISWSRAWIKVGLRGWRFRRWCRQNRYSLVTTVAITTTRSVQQRISHDQQPKFAVAWLVPKNTAKVPFLIGIMEVKRVVELVKYLYHGP